jgi:hypothetical protein
MKYIKLGKYKITPYLSKKAMCITAIGFEVAHTSYHYYNFSINLIRWRIGLAISIYNEELEEMKRGDDE